MNPKIRDEAEILRDWRKRLGFNQVQAGAVLGRRTPASKSMRAPATSRLPCARRPPASSCAPRWSG